MVIQERRGLVKRRSSVMESGSAAEVRRLHIVYFLSRKGHIEHPHLVRVHHLSRNGVRLRDIKRWLGELRGKDMPHSFSWSYKRKYKTGYLWQDLMDDDLITPISDNEYVLKGSEISSSNIVIKKGGLSFSDKKVATNQKNEASTEVYKNNTFSKDEEKRSHSPSSSEASSIYISPKSSSGEILEEEESPIFGSETSTLTDDTPKPQQENAKQQAKDKIENTYFPFYSTLLSNKKKNKRKENKVVKILDEKPMDTTSPKTSSPSEPSNFSKSKSNKFRNLITCGAVETNDSAMVMINKQNHKPFLNMCSSSDLEKNVHHSAEICKRDPYKQLGSSQRIFGNPKWTQQPRNGRKSIDGIKDSTKSNKSEIRENRVPCKLINGPTCSQCGKQFKPDKLTSHMKSCKGMKAALSSMAALSVISNATHETISQRRSSTGTQDENPLSGYLLAH